MSGNGGENCFLYVHPEPVEGHTSPSSQLKELIPLLTLSQIRNRINALQRKYAKELAVYRLRPLAEDFSQQCAASP